MPGSLARPPTQWTQRQRRQGKLTGELTVGARRRPGRWHLGVSMVVAAQRHRPVGYDGEEQHLAHGQATTTAPHLGGAGVAGMPSNRRWRRRPSSRRREEEQQPQQGRARADRAAQGRTQLGRRAETMATNGGETNRSPWSEERARGGGANAPHGNGGDRRSSLELSGEAVGDSQSLERGID
jgi:hypothetical protein